MHSDLAPSILSARLLYSREGKRKKRKRKKKEVGYVLEAAALEFPIQYLVYYTAEVSVSI
jgi:hypothetical protein